MRFSVLIVYLIFIFALLVSCLDEKAGKKHSDSEIRTVSGRVVAVADGDTLTVLDSHKVQQKIRLAGIDTPEKSQSFGKRAKNLEVVPPGTLENIVAHTAQSSVIEKIVTIEPVSAKREVTVNNDSVEYISYDQPEDFTLLYPVSEPDTDD